MNPDRPYVGPRAFTQKERSLFFGRDREVEDLIHLLLAERIVLLHSPSGAGKSSLLEAGLIPKLQELGFETRGPMRVNDFANLPWEEQFSKDPHGEVLIFDQFEEIVTVDSLNVAAKARFFQQLGRALHNRQRWAVFAIREDYLAALDPYLNSIPTRLSNTFRLNLLGEKGAKDAICMPAKNAGIPFTEEASHALFDDLRTIQIQLPDGGIQSAKGEFVEPVQLQVACARIWSDLPADAQTIEIDHIRINAGGRNAGGKKDAAGQEQTGKNDSFSEVDRALADYYSATVGEVAKIPKAVSRNITERTLRDWFEQRLITRQGIRTQVLRSEGLGEEISDGLIEAHVVRSEMRSNRDFLELAHDRLIQPVLASNKQWRDANLSPFQQEAEKWNQNSERSPDHLLRGQALQQAEAWAKNNVPNAPELDFLRASERARRALWLGRIVTALLGILLVAAASFAWEFYKEKKSYSNALTAGREAARELVFQTDQKLGSQVPNTLAIRKELLEDAINLNQKLGVSGEGEYGVALTDWYAKNTQGKLDEIDGKPEEARTRYQEAQVIAEKLLQHHGDDPWAQHILWRSYAALGDLYEKQGNAINDQADRAKDKEEQQKDKAEADNRWLEASQQFEKALPIALKLVNRDPKNRIWREGLYFLYKGLGETVRDDGDARKFYHDGLEVSLSLAQDYARDDGVFTWQSLIDLGDLSIDDRDEKGAIALYQQALLVAEALAKANPPGTDPDARVRHLTYGHDLWESYMALGDVKQDIRNRRSWYERALALAKELDKQSQDSDAQKATGKRSASGSGEGQPKKDLADASRALQELHRGTTK
jgi:hypothetical protein